MLWFIVWLHKMFIDAVFHMSWGSFSEIRKSLTENASISERMDKQTQQEMTYLYPEER